MNKFINIILFDSKAANVGVNPYLHGILTSAPAFIKKLQNDILYNFAA